ncbi:hypothetical protein L596_024572 [Steinernema carpocapsae]|uniref:Uncharacterized protein n=1 Tax=Steinernema carpocapsae TaxID=34508 RepID=A0A4U5MHH3_STECR|nr:hypothetical protein L596_024572 [Steinernema carpocapsae]
MPPHSTTHPPAPRSANGDVVDDDDDNLFLASHSGALMDEQFVGSPVLFQQLITARRCAQTPKIERDISSSAAQKPRSVEWSVWKVLLNYILLHFLLKNSDF